MRRQKGLTFIEMLIVLAIIGVIAGILFPSIARVNESNIKTVTDLFQKHFGIDLKPYATTKDPSLWLDDDQKAVVRPLVAERLAKICAPHQYSESSKAEPGTNTAEIVRQLALLQARRDAVHQAEYARRQCAEARYTATRLGLIIETP